MGRGTAGAALNERNLKGKAWARRELMAEEVLPSVSFVQRLILF